MQVRQQAGQSMSSRRITSSFIFEAEKQKSASIAVAACVLS